MSAAEKIAEDVVDALLARLSSDPSLLRRLRSALGSPTAIVVGGLVTKRECADALRVTPATIDRAVRAGCPFETVGTRRRFDVTKVREWFQSRGRRPATPSIEDPVDISKFAARLAKRKKR